MSINKILVPSDFSDASHAAVDLAATIAKKSDLGLALLHIQNGKKVEDSEDQMVNIIESLKIKHRLDGDFIIKKGNIFSDIPRVACEECYRLMVIGSHGFKGIREKFFGADILKLIKSIPIPVVVTQKNYIEPEHGIKNIVLPAASHEDFERIIRATALIAGMFDAKVHIYTIDKPGQEWPDRLKSNIEKAKEIFDAKKIRYIRVKEQATTYSVGYSRQTLQYAERTGADLISLMSMPTREFHYFADSDKEQLLTNEAGIPVLCTSDKKAV
jgi:nucleotide-binding universal stress UspA family protein